MFIPYTAVAAAALVLGLAPTIADAGQAYRRHGGHHQPVGRMARPHDAAAAAAEAPDTAPGAAIRAQARANQYAPGVTNELAPDNIATATGGPSGGVPGFSGR